MHVEHGQARAAFLEGLGTLVDVAESLDDRQLLSASRCHGWERLRRPGPCPPRPAGDAARGRRPDRHRTGHRRRELLAGLAAEHRRRGRTRSTPIGFARRVASAYRLPRGLVAHLRMTADGVGRAVADMQPGAGGLPGSGAVHRRLPRDLGRRGRGASPGPRSRPDPARSAGGGAPARENHDPGARRGGHCQRRGLTSTPSSWARGRQEIEPPDAASGHGAVLDALPVL